MLLFLNMFTVKSLSKTHVSGFRKSRKCSITPPGPPLTAGEGEVVAKGRSKEELSFCLCKTHVK